jgi:hypothetical protein
MDSITRSTRCGRCGKLFDQHPRHADGKLGRWEVGHVLDGNNMGPLRIEHSLCNRRAGGKLGYARMAARRSHTPAEHTVPRHNAMHYNLDDLTSVGAPPCVRGTGSLCDVCVDWRARNSNPRG